MKLTKQQIKTLCKGATIGIEKYLVDRYNLLSQKYKVGDEIEYCLTLKKIIDTSEKMTSGLQDCDIKLKIISETEENWIIIEDRK